MYYFKIFVFLPAMKNGKIEVLIIIPARGGSRGIPRKNIRALNGKPLIQYSIETSLQSRYSPDVYVSSDDDEILLLAQRFGSKTYKRPAKLGDAITTLDPVIEDAYRHISATENKKYELVITVQPTSPLLKTSTLDSAIDVFLQKEDVDVLISAKEKRHLTWRKEQGQFIPNYKERLNRQQLPAIYEETGSFVICRSSNIDNYHKRIAGKVELINLPKHEAIDIDDYEDWALCEFYLKRKRILFVLTGNATVGLGHVYRSIVLAYGILAHELVFLVDKDSDLAFKKLSSLHFTTYLQKHKNIIDDIRLLEPDIVINDMLDTSTGYMNALRPIAKRIINFEDLGEGAKLADIVINALYKEKVILKNHYFGSSYYCARDEFVNAQTKEIGKVKKVLLSFGGVDPNNYTLKVLRSIYPFCEANSIKITVVEGLGYQHHNSLKDFKNIECVRNIHNISDYFAEADIIFTSAGRTVYEIACIGTPTIVLAQNERELSHFFADKKFGFVNLGLGTRLGEKDILDSFIHLLNHPEERRELQKRMLSYDVKNGKKRTLKLIKNTIDEID